MILEVAEITVKPGLESAMFPLRTSNSRILQWFTAAVVLGVGAGIDLRLLARYLMGPMAVSAVLHFSGVTDFEMPSVALAAAQVVIGTTVGCRFAMASPRKILKVIGLSIGSTFLLLCISLDFAGGLAYFTGDWFITLMLAYSPGGVAEMSIIALSLEIEVPFVVFHHIVRVLLVVGGRRWCLNM
ncbi:AbrB family transcriptional regulator [Ensifer adhaerens]|uniref:AbrB family transcriptional regulator n=1 Tax=Ensifer adhaerens TaxID=106592 RepID=UPI00069E88FC|nr:AbrB family transcriptional regulator [Ensifer adhaerens]